MSQRNLLNKNVTVLGLGLTGQSCVRFLTKQGAIVTAMDSRPQLKVSVPAPVYLGEFERSKLCQAQLIVVSPGLDLANSAIQAAIKHGVEVIGDIELFAWFNQHPIIAITGSNGKSTVTSLVAEMFKAAGKKVLLGGNIGIPVLDLLGQDADMLVLELSSFQLETTTSLKPLVATILNLSDDHLDRHGDRQTYQKAKQRIYHQATYTVSNRDDLATYPDNGKADLEFGATRAETGFGWDSGRHSIVLDGQPFFASQDALLVGAHNMLNIQAAAAVSLLAGLLPEYVKQGARTFGGLPHRCQTVSRDKHISWINDSKATNVGATVAAIQGIAGNCLGKLILIAGGEGKGADFSPLAEIFNQSVDVLITLGKDGDQIARLKTGSIKVASLEAAVYQAALLATENDTVLLSPACASLDMFDNYQHRGECFARAVEGLTA